MEPLSRDQSIPDTTFTEYFSVDVLQQIQALPDEERKCVLLHYAGGYTHDQIAESLGHSPETVRNNLSRAISSVLKSEKNSVVKSDQRWLSRGVMNHSLPVNGNTENGSEKLLNEHEVAQRLRVSVASVRRWRYRGGGPRCFRIGSLVRYTVSDVAAFLSSCRGE